MQQHHAGARDRDWMHKNEYDAVTQALKTGVKYTSGDTVEELDLLDRRLHEMYIK